MRALVDRVFPKKKYVRALGTVVGNAVGIKAIMVLAAGENTVMAVRCRLCFG